MATTVCKHCKVTVEIARVCSSCGKNPTMAPLSGAAVGMGIGFSILALVLVVGGIALVIRNANKEPPRPDPAIQKAMDNFAAKMEAAQKAAEPPPTEITADKLAQVYDANEVSADDALKGKRLAVTGTIRSIDKDFMDDIVVHLKTREMFKSVAATLKPSEKRNAAALSKGQKVRLVCTGAGRIIGDPILKDCAIE